MCSPHFRVAMHIAKSLYPIHCQWVKFADAKSPINKMSPSGSRALERVTEERYFLSVITSLADDWRHVLVDGYEFLRKESIRAYLLVLAPTESHVEECWTKIMSQATITMPTKAHLYFVEGGMDIGLSILHITDPYMAPSYARSLLDFLMNRNVEDADILVEAPILWKVDSDTHAYPLMTFCRYRKQIRKSFNECESTTDGLIYA